MAAESADGFNRDYAALAEGYARDVVDGAIVACKWVRLACQRHLDDLARASADPDWGYHFDSWHAGDVCDFIEKLPHVEGSWKTSTITLELAQIFILAVVFGWRKTPTDGSNFAPRRFNKVYIEMARKGAKSTLTSGVCLYCLTCEGEVGPQVIIGASTGEQAGKVFKPAKGMVDKSPDLREAFGLQTFVRSIICADNNGFIQTINAKGSTQDGWNPHVSVLDELHAHKTRALFDVMTSGDGARENPLLWIITTAGYNTAGVCYEQRSYVTKVLGGTFEADHYFGVIFTIDEGDDPYDPTVWIKANPMLGVTPKLDSMVRYAKDAKASPASEGEFKTKRLNVWLNAASAWLNMESWKVCGDPKLDWDEFDGLDCWIGGDLADKDDITALVLAAWDADGRLIFKPVFWLPEAVLLQPDHAQGSGPAPYRLWHDQGHLRLTPGDWVDHNEIERQVREWIERYRVRRVTFDQFAAAQGLATRLNEDLGDPDDPLAQILAKNSKSVTIPAKELEARVKAGPARLRHDANPVMDWMASNCVVARRRDETILPIKESPMSANKIDGIDGLVNALEPMTKVGDGEGRSYLETSDVLIL
ncbi:MAG: terminase large subunit [Caulobacteraceae bacterium]|nr:terminase large subunit [Caulobacteraceae bacterium]